MPQLTKGGKWVFGWVVVSSQREITIPPEAYHEYGFRAGEQVMFLRGSRRSGGFGLGRASKLPVMLKKRALAQAQMGEQGRLIAPPESGAQPGQRLLAVRGSGYAPVFITRGPIYEEALKHPELVSFEQEVKEEKGCSEKQTA
jgi:hypothetical protein